MPAGAGGTRSEPSPTRRGPKPAVSDADLLAAIRGDLARSPWTGEGHRKVWARLRAEATQITTVADGKVWLFGVIEHWNAEVMGWLVAKYGTRFEAIQALGMAVRRRCGHLGPGAARGLALRHDHGSNFMPDAFKADAVWGMMPSYAFVAEPESNGCIKRLFRTLKEQATHGRIVRTIDDVRDAVRAFVARYNAEWLIEKNGHRSPADMPAAWQAETFRRAA